MTIQEFATLVINDFINDYDGEFITEATILKYVNNRYEEKYINYIANISELESFSACVKKFVDRYNELCDKRRETLDLRYLLPENQ